MYHEGVRPGGDPLHLEPPHSKNKKCGNYLFAEKNGMQVRAIAVPEEKW